MKPRKAQGRFGSPYGKGSKEFEIKRFEPYKGLEYEFIVFDEVKEMPMTTEKELEEKYAFYQRQAFLREMERELGRQNYKSVKEIQEQNEWEKQQQIKDLNLQPVHIRPTYQYQKLPPPPTHYLIQYIGGPFNAQQEFLSVEENLNIRQGLLWDKFDLSPQLGPNAGKALRFRYRLTFIPQSETPFSDAQVIVGIFQE